MSFDYSTLITDRTQADVAEVARLAAKGWDGMTEAEQTAWSSGLKGAYNAADLNRVTAAMDDIYSRLQEADYDVDYTSVRSTEWQLWDLPTIAELAQYLANIQALRDAIALYDTTPAAPDSMNKLTYASANNIEQILVDLDTVIESLWEALYYSSEIYCGEMED